MKLTKTQWNLAMGAIALAGFLLIFSSLVALGFSLKLDPIWDSLCSALIITLGVGFICYMGGLILLRSSSTRSTMPADFGKLAATILKYKNKTEWSFDEIDGCFVGTHELWIFRIYMPSEDSDWGWKLEVEREGYAKKIHYVVALGYVEEPIADLIVFAARKSKMNWGRASSILDFDPILAGLEQSLKKKES